MAIQNGTQQIEVLTSATTAVHEGSYYPGFIPEPLLKTGSVQLEGHQPLPCDILFEHDVKIKVRDGTTLYADIYRPPRAKLGSLPAIMVAGPFGKNGGPNRYHFDRCPWRMGCPRKATSGLEKFEGPDPAYWCFNGYAVVHTDNRGCWKSEGDASIGCVLEGQDGYDLVEWIAEQEWCNGKVTMAGNSYLAQTQWFVGAERPPHLACLAPWEGWSDLYNDTVRRGGIPNPGFIDGLLRGNIAGNPARRTENLAAMTDLYPCWNSYWADRKPQLAEIECPLYVVASWTNALHTAGTFRGFIESGSSKKWLRVHNSHEWPDLYDARNVEDLRSFYDFFMKGINNDWPHTPIVRLSVLDAGGSDIINRPEATFPLQRQEQYKLYLNAKSNELCTTSPPNESFCSYDALTGSVCFTAKITASMEFTGYMKLRVWAEAQGSNDMDIFMILQKFDSAGNLLESPLVDVGRFQDDPEKERNELKDKHAKDHSYCEGYFASGPTGCLRASHRALDINKSTDFQPVYSNMEEQLLRPGEVVPLDIAIWPYGMICKKGEELRLTISGTNPRPHLRPTDVKPILRNEGRHNFYSGGERQSYLLLPLIKYG